LHLAYQKRTLANGLDVIVHEDRRIPLVAVSVWYHVGSKNERAGRTGLAHLFEHLMFEGSEHQPRSYFEPLQIVGGSINGSTNTDRTDYWEVVPTEATYRALWMEADRMGWLLPALTPERFETQRGVVLNERRQNYEHRPYGLAQFAISKALYPAGHPYSWPTIGEVEDLHAATVDDARAFFTRFYHPGNASLVVAGDIVAADAFDRVAELFGEIPRGPDVDPVVTGEVRARGERLVLEDRVDLTRLYFSWPTPPLYAAGDAELDLAADMLANGRTSRLYRRLVHDRRLVTDVAAAQSSRELVSAFQIVATLAPGQDVADVRDAIADEIRSFQDDGPDEAELVRGRARAEAAFVYRVQSLGGFGGRADQLNAYNVYRGDPDSFDHDLARYLTAGRESVQHAARSWLTPEHALELTVIPLGS
jgi:zinc protease